MSKIKRKIAIAIEFARCQRGLISVSHFSLLSGGGDGVIVIHDVNNTSGVPQCTYPSICSVGRSNRYKHKFSVQTIQWYPLDTGMFISSGFDKLLKVWDTNTLVVSCRSFLSLHCYNQSNGTDCFGLVKYGSA